MCTSGGSLEAKSISTILRVVEPRDDGVVDDHEPLACHLVERG